MPIEDAPVAQLDRASDYGSEGCKFESCRARQKTTPPFFGGFFCPLFSQLLSAF